MGSKWQRLAHFLVSYSTRIQKGEVALIHFIGEDDHGFVSILMDEIFQAGGQPLIWQDNPVWLRQMIMAGNDKAFEIMMANRLAEIKKVQVVFHLFKEGNVFEHSDIPADQYDAFLKQRQPIDDWRNNKTRRISTCLPNSAAAQMAGMSSAQFEQFHFDVCLGVDYPKMSRAMDLLVARMQEADLVRITGPGTNLTFSIWNMPAIKCAGTENLPDGEVFTAPRAGTVNGEITFNTPTVYAGQRFDPMTLKYGSGVLLEIICHNASQQKAAEEILHSDKGAQRIGEFAFGLNPKITKPVGEILYDEKITGSLHVTPGCCYEAAYNGNKSAIHWDMILRQTGEFGGGQVYFDDRLVRSDGLFLGELAALNPDNLKV